MTTKAKTDIIRALSGKNRLTLKKLQVSPSGMAAASQAVPGEFDSRHLLHKRTGVHFGTIRLELFEGGAYFY